MKATVSINQIATDTSLQPREHMSTDLIAEYSECMIEGDTFPPLVVFRSHPDGLCYLADGYHRFSAARQIGMVEVEVDVHEGSKRDAQLYSVGANANHGQRRTNEDKRRAVTTLLDDNEWSAKSDNWIAEQCHVDHKTVAKIRTEHLGNPKSNVRETSDGRTMDTSNIGRRSEPKPASRVEDIPNRFTEGGEWPNDDFEDDTDFGISEEETTAEPDTGQRQATYLYPDVDSAVEMLMDVLRIQMPKIDPAISHEVVNTTIKKLRELSIQYHRESVGAS